MPDLLQRRRDMPDSFALPDAICDRLGASQIDAVRPDFDFNADVVEIRGERGLGPGMVPWQALLADEKLALIGHEAGQLINKDPVRGRLPGPAGGLLDRWSDLTRPDPGDPL